MSTARKPRPANIPRPRRALILAGGGMRVAYQAGVLKALDEAGIGFDHADGASGGTLNLAMLLSGVRPEEICQRWRTLNVRDSISLLPLRKYLRSRDRIALGDADGIVNRIFPHLGIDVKKIRANTKLEGTFNVSNFTRKTLEVVPHTSVDQDVLVAAISLPIFMPPVARNGSQYVDAVWVKDANLMEAVRRGADELWLVWCIGDTPDYQAGVFQQYVHMIELSAHGGLFEEFRQIEDLNARIRAGEKVGGRTRPIVLHVVRPAVALPLDPDLYLGNVDTATLIDMGYADAWTYLRTRRKEGLPFDPSVTKMSRGGLGITFRETMAGDFSFGVSDPAEGARAGALKGSRLSLHATIAVHDLDSFRGDPKHEGSITGHVDVPSFGADIPAKDGRFSLFSPSGEPRLRKMVYEVGFQHDGQDYYLAGWKEVRDDKGFDLWKDTTTLFVRLHRGRDVRGTVVGAGILRLGVRELTRLVASMRPLHHTGVDEGVLAVARFGSFFLGRLWGTYGRPRWWHFLFGRRRR